MKDSRNIIKVKEWKDRQFIMLDPGGEFKHLARAERIIDKKIFTQHDPAIYEREFNSSDIPNLEKVVQIYICIREFYPDLKHLRLEYGWSVSKSFYENGKWVKDRIISWGDDNQVVEMNDLEKDVEELILMIKESIIENKAFINKWEGEKIEQYEFSFGQ